MFEERIEAMIKNEEWMEAKKVINEKFMLDEITFSEMEKLYLMVEHAYREWVEEPDMDLWIAEGWEV